VILDGKSILRGSTQALGYQSKGAQVWWEQVFPVALGEREVVGDGPGR